MEKRNYKSEERKLPFGVKFIGWAVMVMSILFGYFLFNYNFMCINNSEVFSSNLDDCLGGFFISFLFFVSFFASIFLIRGSSIGRYVLVGVSFLFIIYTLKDITHANLYWILSFVFVFIFACYLLFNKKVKEAFK